jgi:hypothetical protein
MQKGTMASNRWFITTSDRTAYAADGPEDVAAVKDTVAVVVVVNSRDEVVVVVVNSKVDAHVADSAASRATVGSPLPASNSPTWRGFDTLRCRC